MRNNKPIVKTIFNLFLVFLLIIPIQMYAQNTQAKKIIYETNMCLAVDDVGGLAMIHGLQNRGEAELLAVCLNEVHPDGAAAIDAINTWYGRGNIPVGVYRGAFPDPDNSAYLHDLTKFSHDLDDKSALSALEVYQKVLVKQPDNSVTSQYSKGCPKYPGKLAISPCISSSRRRCFNRSRLKGNAGRKSCTRGLLQIFQLQIPETGQP